MSDFEITYAAHTASCTFLLDAEGICRRIVMVALSKLPPHTRQHIARRASRCVGAQYVASLDATLPGLLAGMPRVGAPMLFVQTDARGRLSLVRTGVVTRFETHRPEDPFASPPRARSLSVETSAPEIALSTTSCSKEPDESDVYDDHSIDRTQPGRPIGTSPRPPLQAYERQERPSAPRPISPRTERTERTERQSGPPEVRPSPFVGASQASSDTNTRVVSYARHEHFRQRDRNRESEPPPSPGRPSSIPPTPSSAKTLIQDRTVPRASHRDASPPSPPPLPVQSEPSRVRPRGDAARRSSEPPRPLLAVGQPAELRRRSR